MLGYVFLSSTYSSEIVIIQYSLQVKCGMLAGTGIFQHKWDFS